MYGAVRKSCLFFSERQAMKSLGEEGLNQWIQGLSETVRSWTDGLRGSTGYTYMWSSFMIQDPLTCPLKGPR